jgi:hypothetical protein
MRVWLSWGNAEKYQDSEARSRQSQKVENLALTEKTAAGERLLSPAVNNSLPAEMRGIFLVQILRKAVRKAETEKAE